MRKKPDLLLLLTVLVVSGVIISNFVVSNHPNKNSHQLSLLNTKYGQLEPGQLSKIRAERDIELAKFRLHKLKTQQFAHID
ncbi:hypothetical protein [sulfur-oxidizing endosymbiont of Gigantopelta aegis]|uniref:hypothetical protein n=1 Tax=sulfur-oxidizing endosymbiont of Gigantopelta aegis TaxID=2794934 RepID=UPI0018DDDE65|nr:hypothetical protein [sulfur-oxidizing endosymbiont of Gigantopelta aegis]